MELTIGAQHMILNQIDKDVSRDQSNNKSYEGRLIYASPVRLRHISASVVGIGSLTSQSSFEKKGTTPQLI